MFSYLDAAIWEGLILEAATPWSIEENIKRGRMAMKHVISSHKMEPRAMYRQDIGWIGFEWGKPGNAPPEFKNDTEALNWWRGLKSKRSIFIQGYGISHIIAKRDWEGKHIREFLGQKGVEVAFKLVEVIAKGDCKSEGQHKLILWDGFRAVLRRPKSKFIKEKKDEEWLLTGYQIEKEGYEFVLETAGEVAVKPPHFKPSGTTPTCPKPYGTRKWTGAAISIERYLYDTGYEVNKGWLYDL